VEPKAAVADLLAWWLRPERSRLGCRIYIYIYIYIILAFLLPKELFWVLLPNIIDSNS
jgi:hypothetical protein